MGKGEEEGLLAEEEEEEEEEMKLQRFSTRSYEQDQAPLM